MNLERTSDHQMFNAMREKYARDWSFGHAQNLSTNGHYKWMAKFLAGQKLVLEIGAGDGRGTIALVENGSAVVSIEKNPYCFELAKHNLLEAGIPLVTAPRGRVATESSSTPEVFEETVVAEIPSEGVLLLGGDIMFDARLHEWLKFNAPFDGIACWNIGSHRLDAESQNFRLRVQNCVYDLAHEILHSGGTLHIVDRGRAPISERLDEMIQTQLDGHRDQASTTDLEVDSAIESRVYRPPENTGIELVPADTSKFEFDLQEMGFWSIISRKP